MEPFFNGYRLHFGGHLGSNKFQKSMPKFIEKIDAIGDAISNCGRSYRATRKQNRFGVRAKLCESECDLELRS